MYLEFVPSLIKAHLLMTGLHLPWACWEEALEIFQGVFKSQFTTL